MERKWHIDADRGSTTKFECLTAIQALRDFLADDGIKSDDPHWIISVTDARLRELGDMVGRVKEEENEP